MLKKNMLVKRNYAIYIICRQAIITSVKLCSSQAEIFSSVFVARQKMPSFKNGKKWFNKKTLLQRTNKYITKRCYSFLTSMFAKKNENEFHVPILLELFYVMMTLN